MRRSFARLAIGLLMLVSTPLAVLSAAPASAEDNGLARTPPMGFNDWNAFKCNVSAQLIEQTADQIVSSGLKAAGYQYVNIDDCWLSPARDADGRLVPDPAKFPGGIKAVAEYVHAKGLKLGIYEDAGTLTCAGYPGSLGHEATDAQTFADWDVDYLKYDQCNIPFANYPGMTHQQIDTQLYATMSKALKATGRPIVFSMCNGTDAQALPWLWGAPVSNLWRTTTDIQDAFSSMVSLVHQNSALARYAGPGAWNDPDMLEIGNGGMTDTEYRSEFSLWSEMAAPLIAGTDLRTASSATLAIYGNRDVIAVDQDTLGRQGTLVSSANGLDVFAKPLADGSVSVALFNETGTAATIGTDARSVGLRSSLYRLDDLWSRKVTESAGRIAAFVPAHGTVMYKVSKADGLAALRYQPSTVLSVSAGASQIRTGGSADVTVSLADNGLLPVGGVRLSLSVPAGWNARRISAGWSSARYRVTAPAAGAPLSSVALTGSASYRSLAGRGSAQSEQDLLLVSPVATPYATADTTGTAPVFGQSCDDFAIQAAGAGVSPATTRGTTTTPAADEYGAIYLKGAAGGTSTVQTTVTGQDGTSRTAKAGLMIRDDATAGGSPEGVVLYVTGSRTVAMAWSANGGPTVDTQSAASAAVAYPVHLRLVRNGSSYTGSYSTDGTTWVQVATATLPASAAAATQDAALFHTSGSTAAPSRAAFTDLTVS